jgi:hypothetical protein
MAYGLAPEELGRKCGDRSYLGIEDGPDCPGVLVAAGDLPRYDYCRALREAAEALERAGREAESARAGLNSDWCFRIAMALREQADREAVKIR